MGIETNLEVFPGISFQTNIAAGYQVDVIDAAKYGHDPLTGLLNQATFESQVARHVLNTPPSASLNALFRIDVDRFIRINDCFGFATGDVLLTKLAQRLEATIADLGGIIGRLKQDEFVIFISAIDSENKAASIARRLLQIVAQPLHWNGRQFFLTASIGIVLQPQDAGDITVLLERAGHEQQSVRNRGRNGFQIARSTVTENRTPVRQSAQALAKAIERDEIFLVYQPILNVHSRQLVGVEALLRWRHPEFGILTPDRFLPLANETGLIVDLGEWALSNACAQVSEWDRLGFNGLSLGVNFSCQQLQIHKVVNRIESILSRTNFDHSRLSVELGGGGHGQVDAYLTQTLQEIKESGVKLALDNFGVGQVSLDNLHDLPLDSLKIDRSVIRKISTSSQGESLVKALTLLGKSFGLRVEAEGVETTQQFDLLDREGCNNAQGYFLSRPLTPDAVLDLMQAAGNIENRK
jgi:diguanylate cyclase (GGDEF)-like protein